MSDIVKDEIGESVDGEIKEGIENGTDGEIKDENPNLDPIKPTPVILDPSTISPKTESKFICEVIDSTGPWLSKHIIWSIDRPRFEIITKDGERSFNWFPIEFRVYDVINPSTTEAIWRHILRKESFNINIQLFNSEGQQSERWNIVNANIISLDFGTINWSSRSIEQNKLYQSSDTVKYFNGSSPLSIRIRASYQYAELVLDEKS